LGSDARLGVPEKSEGRCICSTITGEESFVCITKLSQN